MLIRGRLLDVVHAAAVAAGAEPPSADDLADALWFSTMVVRRTIGSDSGRSAQPGGPLLEAPSDDHGGARTDPPSTVSKPLSTVAEPAQDGSAAVGQLSSPSSDGSVAERSSPAIEPTADWRLPPKDRVLEPSSWVALRSPGADPLPQTLAMGRALRPLRRRMPSRTDVMLDVDATVYQAAEKDLWLPEHRPAPDRWLDLALVVDISRSMAIWRPQIDEIRMMMERLGAFRDVRVWHVDGDLPPGGTITLRSGTANGSAGHDVRELVDPAGLRLVLVVSDCVGAAWGGSAMERALWEWGQAGPVAVLQMLPQRLWAACAPKLLTVSLTSPRPAAPNSALRVTCEPQPAFDPFGIEDGAGVIGTEELPVPVLELQPRWLSRWAALVASPGRQSQPGTVMVVRAPDPNGGRDVGRAWENAERPGHDSGSVRHAEPKDDDPEVLLARYQDFASTEALQLARCLAAAPLSLPVMRLVRQTMLPQSRPSVLAEVFLGGLLRQSSSPDGTTGQDVDSVEYDFVPGVRERLLSSLHQRHKLEVLSRVSDFIAARLGSPNDFRAFVSVGTQVPQVLEDHPPFAKVALGVLAGMGGRYSDAAERLDRLVRKPRLTSPDAPKLDKLSGLETTGPHRHGRTTEAGTGRSDAFTSTYETVYRGDDDHVYASPVSDRSGAVTVQEAGGESVGTVDAPVMPIEQEAVTVSQPQPEQRVSRPSVFGGVPFRNPHFTGREALLRQLRLQLQAGTTELALLPHAVHGLGGVGKTQLAIEYAWRYAGDYQLVWWIPSESPTTVRASLVALANAMGVATPEQDPSKTISTLLDALRVGHPFSRWLLIYDNARSPEELEGLLPVPSGHVVITSRNPDWSDRAALLEVDVFDRSESISLLQRRGSRIGDEDAGRLAEMLGDLPLALDQAAAWQSATGTPAPELVRLLGERMLQLLADRPVGHPASVMATWDLAFTELHRQSPGAARLLELLAFFGSDPIAIPVLRDGRAADLPEDLARVLGDDLLLRRAIREIGRYALAKIDPGGNRIEIHRLVQSVLRERLTPEQAAVTQDAVHRILGAANPGYPDEPRTYERHGELLAHITPSGVIAGSSRAGHLAALDQIRYRFNKGFYSSSAALGQNAVDTWRETRGRDDELTLIAQRHLATSLRELGEYAEAASLNEDTLARFQQVFGEDHEHTLATMLSMNRDLRLQARFEEARGFDEDSLRRHVARYGEEDPETVKARNNLAVDLRMLGKGGEALILDQETYSTAVTVFGPDHNSALGILSNLGRDLTDSGRYEEAIRLLTDAAARGADKLGAWHRITVRAQRNLVIVLRRSGEVERARTLAEELHSRVRAQLPAGHEALLSTIVTFGNALLAAGETARAREHLAEAVQAYQGSAFGAEHPFTQIAAVDLGVALRSAGDYRRAREFDEYAMESLAASVGAGHPCTLVAQINLAHDLALVHEHERALALSEDAYARSRESRGDDRPETLICGLNHAFDLRANGQDEASEVLLARMSENLRAHYGENHPAVRAAAEGRRAESDLEHWDT